MCLFGISCVRVNAAVRKEERFLQLMQQLVFIPEKKQES